MHISPTNLPLVSRFIPQWSDICIAKALDFVWPTFSELNDDLEVEADSPQDLTPMHVVDETEEEEEEEGNMTQDHGFVRKILPSGLPIVSKFTPQHGSILWPITRARDYVWPSTRESTGAKDPHNATHAEDMDLKNVGLPMQQFPAQVEGPQLSSKFTLWPARYIARARDYVWCSFEEFHANPSTVTTECITDVALQRERENVVGNSSLNLTSQKDLALVSSSTSKNWLVSLPGEYVSWICDYVCQPFGNDASEPEEPLTDMNEPLQNKAVKDVNVAFLTYFAFTFLTGFPVIFCASFIIFFLAYFGVAFLITFSLSFILALACALIFSFFLPINQIPPALMACLHPQWWFDHFWQLMNHISPYSIVTDHLLSPKFLWNNRLLTGLPWRFR